jgi:hypothetical protein
MGSCYVAQADLKLVILLSAGITGTYYHAWLSIVYLRFIYVVTFIINVVPFMYE